MKGRISSSLRLLSRWISALLIAPGFSVAADPVQRYQVFLQNADSSLSLNIASIASQRDEAGIVYRIDMNEQQFGDYFLSMRPFKCMTDKVNMLCHLAYPYPIDRRITDDDLTALEHDFLFIRRRPADYGIDPWNGLYYRIAKMGKDYIGKAYEVDLNILAVPPDHPLPLKDAELHEIDDKQLWLPRLLIRPE